MNQSEHFQPGQRVRIRSYVDSDFAGFAGTVVYAGSKACDVRIRYRPRGTKHTSTYIGTFRNEDLESLKRRMDLARFNASAVSRTRSGTWGWCIGGVMLIAVICLYIWY